MKNSLLIIIALFWSIFSIGQSFTVGGITYGVISPTNNTVGVFSSASYVGALVLPQTVDNAGVTYTVVSILDSAFQGSTTLTSISIPNTVTEIRNGAFRFCSNLSFVDMGTSVTSIGQLSFNACTSLTSVVIPDSVANIGIEAFAHCTNLTSVTVNWQTPIAVHSTAFVGVNVANATLNVPVGTVALYQAAAVWQNFGTIVQPLAGSHLNFDGVDDYITIPHFSRPTTMTIEAYIKSSIAGVDGEIIAWAHPTNAFTAEFRLIQGKLSYGEWSQSNGNFLKVEYTTLINDDNWHHVAVVRNGDGANNVKLFLDGVEVASGTANYTIATQTLNIGAFTNATTTNFFQGNIDDIRVWNIVRSQEEINTSKNCELQGTETGLVAYYKFNQGFDAGNNTTNNSLTDVTSNANNGTLTNFALTGTTSNWLAGSPVGISGVITLQPQDQTVSETDPLIFTVNATGVSSYQWEYSADNGVTWSTLDDTFTNPDVSGSTTNTLTISGIGMIGITGYKFRVILDGTSMCTSTSNEVLATVTLETKSFGISNVKVYPNPSTGIFTIDIVEELEFTVYDIVGKTIINQKSLVGSNTLDLSRFEKGIYLLSLMSTKGETNTYKLIKE